MPKDFGDVPRPPRDIPVLQLSDYQLCAWLVQEVMTSQSEQQNAEHSYCVFINILQRNIMEGSAYVSVHCGFMANCNEEMAPILVLTLAKDLEKDTLRLGIKAH